MFLKYNEVKSSVVSLLWNGYYLPGAGYMETSGVITPHFPRYTYAKEN